MAPHFHPEGSLGFYSCGNVGISNPAATPGRQIIREPRTGQQAAESLPLPSFQPFGIDQVHSICIFKDVSYSNLVCSSLLRPQGDLITGKVPAGSVFLGCGISASVLPSSCPSSLGLGFLIYPPISPSHWQFLIRYISEWAIVWAR